MATTEKKSIYEALVSFQGEIGTIGFDATVKVITKSGSTYNFKYATLAQIVETVKPVLEKNNLSVFQGFKTADGKQLLVTIVYHTSGQSLPESIIELRNTGSSQERGAEISYMRRYAYSAALGLVSDEDTDCDHTESKSFEKENSEKSKEPIKEIEPIKTLNNQKATPPIEKIKPTLTENLFDKAMIRIKSGEADVFKKLKNAFTIKEAYQVQLEKAESESIDKIE